MPQKCKKKEQGRSEVWPFDEQQVELKQRLAFKAPITRRVRRDTETSTVLVRSVD